MKRIIFILLFLVFASLSTFAQTSLQGRIFSVTAYGAKGDGSTNDTTAIAAAVAATVASPGGILYFPSGTYPCDPSTVIIATNSITIRGDGVGRSVLKNRSAGSAITLNNASALTHSILIENLSISGFGSGSTDIGINVTSASNEPFGLTVQAVTINNVAGRGIYVSNNLFTSRFVDVDVSVLAAGTNGIDISGGADIVLENCYVHAVGTGGAAYRIHAGNVVMIGCNGIDSGTTADWLVLGDSIATGDPSDRFARAILIACNVEAFTNRGVYAKAGSYVSEYRGVTFLAPAAGTVTPVKYDFVDTAQRGTWDSASSFATLGASYTNSKAINSNGAPFVQIGDTTLTDYYDTGAAGTLTLPSLSVQLVPGSTNTAIKTTRAQITALESSGLVGDLTGANSFAGNAARVILQAGTNSRPTLASTDVNTTGVYFPTSGTTIGMTVSGTQRLLLGTNHTMTGNLGINTSGTSSYALDVATGPSRMTGVMGASDPVLELKSVTNPHLLVNDSANTITARLGTLFAGPDRAFVGTMTNHPFGLYQNGSEKWTVNGSGNFVPGAATTYNIGSASLPINDFTIGGKLYWTGSTVFDFSGSGSPEGVVTAAVGSVYRRTNGGVSTTLYVKESGSGNTGWGAVTSGAGSVGGSGTTNTLAKFTASTTLGDSLVTESASPNTVAIGGRESITGLTINTDATGTVAGQTVAATFTKNDTNSRTFDVVRILPVLNTGGSNTSTTVNFLKVDSTNTGTTGLTVNLAYLAYGGSLKFGVDSAGAVTFANGVRQVFTPSSTVSSLNVGQIGSDPSSPVNGDIVYNTGSNKFRCYENSAWGNCIGATPALTSTQIAYGDGSNLMTSSANLTWNNSTRVLTAVSAAGGNINLSTASTNSAFQLNGATHPGTAGGVMFPFVGGGQSSGPNVCWTSSASYGSTSCLYLNNGLTFQGANSTHDHLKIAEGTATSANGTVRWDWAPTSSLLTETFSTSATGSAHTVKATTITSTGTAAANFGVTETVTLENGSASNVAATSITQSWAVATAGSETGEILFNTNLAGAGVGQAFAVSGSQYYGTLWNKGNISGSVTLDFINGNTVTATLTGNVTSLAFSNLRTGGIYYIHFIQDALGPWTLTQPSAMKVNGGYTITATINTRDLLICSATSTTQLYCSKAQNQQ